MISIGNLANSVLHLAVIVYLCLKYFVILFVTYSSFELLVSKTKLFNLQNL